MESYKVSTAGDVMLNFADVKCLKINSDESVTVEFKERYSFLRNPNTGNYEQIKHNDTTTIHFERNDELSEFLTDFRIYWQNYLEE
jgi:hypothetical protein